MIPRIKFLLPQGRVEVLVAQQWSLMRPLV